MEIINDTIGIEYKNTQDVFHSSNNIFSVFNDLNSQKGKEELAQKFYVAFETIIKDNPLYSSDP